MGEVETEGKSKILIVIIVILLCIGCFVGGTYVGKFIFNKEDTKVGDKKDNTENNNMDNNTNNNTNSSNDEIYDYTRDAKLKEMYELYVPSDSWFGPIGDILTFKEEVIKDTDLSNNVKNHLGYVYKIIGNKERKEPCKNYVYLDELNAYGAGFSACSEESLEDTTLVFDEKDLELSVKELFGNYTASTFSMGSNRFKYESSSKKYVYQYIPAGGVAPAHASKLVNGTKSGNTIAMTIIVSSEKMAIEDVKDSDYDYEFKFTFEVSDGNYIFKSLEKTLIK